MTECLYCGLAYDPIETRWLCPNCLSKGNCCEGEPLPVDVDDDEYAQPGELLAPDDDLSLDELVAAGYDFPLEDDPCLD